MHTVSFSLCILSYFIFYIFFFCIFSIVQLHKILNVASIHLIFWVFVCLLLGLYCFTNCVHKIECLSVVVVVVSFTTLIYNKNCFSLSLFFSGCMWSLFLVQFGSIQVTSLRIWWIFLYVCMCVCYLLRQNLQSRAIFAASTVINSNTTMWIYVVTNKNMYYECWVIGHKSVKVWAFFTLESRPRRVCVCVTLSVYIFYLF